MKTILVDALHTFVSETEGMFQDMYKLLETYPNRKVVLTMATDDLMEKWGFDKLPYEVYSSRFNPKKTEASFYEQMLAHFSLNAADVVYFEHNPDAVKSAESVGIKTHRYDPEKKDLTALKKFLDENL